MDLRLQIDQKHSRNEISSRNGRRLVLIVSETIDEGVRS
jgi:hypothetical protein